MITVGKQCTVKHAFMMSVNLLHLRMCSCKLVECHFRTDASQAPNLTQRNTIEENSLQELAKQRQREPEEFLLQVIRQLIPGQRVDESKPNLDRGSLVDPSRLAWQSEISAPRFLAWRLAIH